MKKAVLLVLLFTMVAVSRATATGIKNGEKESEMKVVVLNGKYYLVETASSTNYYDSLTGTLVTASYKVIHVFDFIAADIILDAKRLDILPLVHKAWQNPDSNIVRRTSWTAQYHHLGFRKDIYRLTDNIFYDEENNTVEVRPRKDIERKNAVAYDVYLMIIFFISAGFFQVGWNRIKLGDSLPIKKVKAIIPGVVLTAILYTLAIIGANAMDWTEPLYDSGSIIVLVILLSLIFTLVKMFFNGLVEYAIFSTSYWLVIGLPITWIVVAIFIYFGLSYYAGHSLRKILPSGRKIQPTI
ncbi:MAG: hypothetical protein NUV82_00975 [Candidatus Komeilibacteria bacterium]|nr:hypothetical protein [Candidatus Komeilibacteria bacterium]